ncbi:MAG: UDP-3-O-acyl-N-acetylglucosamine deacetylase [Alphaproteobacteria bacterium]|jgi:UDP-3-O-[3-hydroxymyristoyl] N-acetylglucosamine deacetylase
MNKTLQKTLQQVTEIKGIGLHSGKKVKLRVSPAKENSGIKFIRTDVNGFDRVVPALYKNVSQTVLGTTISNNDGTIVATIEHLMAALWACEIDNAEIELEGPEIPIMDGSSEPFIKAFDKAGLNTYNSFSKTIEILAKTEFKDGDKIVSLSPANEFSVELELDFGGVAIANQKAFFAGGGNDFKNEISLARTFVFEHEINHLKSKGLAQGGSLDNAIVIGKKGIINKDGFRITNELAKHKILDCIGDLYLAGAKIIGSFSGYKSGHALNNQLLRKLFASNENWRFV